MAVESTLVAIGVAAGFEAYRVWKAAPVARVVIVVIAVAFLGAGVFIDPLKEAIPKVGEFISSMNTPTFWGVLLIGLFFLLRPLWQPKPPPTAADVTEPVDIGQAVRNWLGNDSTITSLRADLVEMGRRLAKTTERLDAVENLPERLDALETKITNVSNALKTTGETLAVKAGEGIGQAAGAMMRVEALEALVRDAGQVQGQAQGAVATSIRQIEARQSLEDQDTRARFAAVSKALTAIRDRERLHTAATAIRDGAEHLSAPTVEGAKYDRDGWERWQARYAIWKGVVTDWWSIASFYSSDVGPVLDVSPEQLKEKGVAKADQFPEPEDFFEYKGFWVIYKQFMEAEPEAERAIREAAFGSER